MLSLLRGSVSRYIRLNSRVSNLASYSFKETTVEIIESHFLERRNQSKRRKMKLSFVVYQIFTNFDTLRDVLVPVRVKTRKKTLWCNFSESQREQRSRRIENKSSLIFYQAFCLFRSLRLFLYRELEWWICDEEMAGNFVLFIKVSFLWITFSQIKIMESWKKWKFFCKFFTDSHFCGNFSQRFKYTRENYRNAIGSQFFSALKNQSIRIGRFYLLRLL